MKAIENGEAFDAIAAFATSSDAALKSAQLLNDAWIRYFESLGPEPSADWIAEVAALQLKSELDLQAARRTLADAPAGDQVPASALETVKMPDAPLPETTRRKHRRHAENKFLRRIGRPAQKVLRVVLLLSMAASGLAAAAGAISVALEIAGYLHLIDDSVQLPLGSQLALFIAGALAFVGLRRLLRPVERALYGSKGVRPMSFPL